MIIYYNNVISSRERIAKEDYRMKKLLLLFLALSILTSCQSSPVENESPDTPETEADETTAEKPSPYPEIETSTEEWLRVGLEYYLSGTEVRLDPLSYFTENGITVLALYNDWFYIDKDTASDIAALFFRYVMDNYGYDALFDLDKRIEYKDAFLKSLSPDLSYVNNQDIETLFSQMICREEGRYLCIFELEGNSYYFESFEDYNNSPSLVHQIVYYSTMANRQIREYIRGIENHEQYFDPDRELHYYMNTMGDTIDSVDSDTGKIYVNSSFYQMAPSAVPALGLEMSGENTWLAVGLGEYIGKSLGFNDYVDSQYYSQIKYALDGLLDSYTDPHSTYYKELAPYYEALAGTPENLEDFSTQAYVDAVAAHSFIANNYKPLSQIYFFSGDGSELTLWQAGSFVGYLAEQYSVEKVLAAYTEPSKFAEIFGSTYAELNEQWKNHIMPE